MKGLISKLISGKAAVAVSSFLETNVKSGRQYYLFDEQTYAAGASTDYLFRTPAKKWIDIKFSNIETSGPSFYIDIFEAATVTDTGANQLTIRNWNRPLKNFRPAGLGVWINPTLGGDGDLIDRDIIYGTADNNEARANGGINTEGVSRILDPNTDYIIRIRNEGDSERSAFIKVTWYEGRLNPDPDVVAGS